MNRSEILKRADEIINGERQTSYGKPESNLGFIAALWTVYLDHLVTSEDVALMMALFKIARCKTGVGTEDSFVDACGYMAIGGEIATAGKYSADEMKKIADDNKDKRKLLNAIFGDCEEDDYDDADHA